MTTFLAWILGYTQIIVESLPVSSSGHISILVLLLGRIFGIDVTPSELWDDLIQWPTILVYIFFWGASVARLVFVWRRSWLILLRMSFYLLLGGHVTAFWYFLFKYTNLTSFWPLWLGFMITGILLASLAWCEVGTRRVNVWRVAVLGCVQGLALLPGVSRFATVFVVSRWLGLPIRRAVAITFALQFPLQMAAGLRGVYHFFGADCAYVLNIWMLLGMMLAIAGAYWLLWYMVVLAYTRRLYRFSWYMLMPIFFSMMLGL